MVPPCLLPRLIHSLFGLQSPDEAAAAARAPPSPSDSAVDEVVQCCHQMEAGVKLEDNVRQPWWSMQGPRHGATPAPTSASPSPFISQTEASSLSHMVASGVPPASHHLLPWLGLVLPPPHPISNQGSVGPAAPMVFFAIHPDRACAEMGGIAGSEGGCGWDGKSPVGGSSLLPGGEGQARPADGLQSRLPVCLALRSTPEARLKFR